MPERSIASVGFRFRDSAIKYIEFGKNNSLLDFDVIMFRADIRHYMFSSETYNGKPCLNDDKSFSIRRHMEHWRREIRDAVDNGKTVIVFMSDLTQISIATGELKYTGSGRNARVERMVTDYDNYQFLPYALRLTSSVGSSMVLASAKAEPLVDYWKSFEPYSSYKVILEGAGVSGELLTRNGGKTVGLIVRSRTSNGALVLLPDVDVETRLSGVTEEKGGLRPSAESRKFSDRLISAVVSIDKAIKESVEITPEPPWAADFNYKLKAEIDIERQISALDAEFARISAETAGLKDKLLDISSLRGLLYEKGHPLEKSIIKALRILGYEADGLKTAVLELDVVFTSPEGRLIGEAEGKDDKPVNVTKLRQLALNVHEDFARDDVETLAKGVLFGNGYRLTAIAERGDPFTDKCQSASQASSAALVSTPDLFLVAKYLSENSDPDFAKRCREAIGSAVGRVSFPAIP